MCIGQALNDLHILTLLKIYARHFCSENFSKSRSQQLHKNRQDMKKPAWRRFLPFMLFGISYFIWQQWPVNTSSVIVFDDLEEKTEKVPNDYFFRQRAYPSGEIPKTAYLNALKYKAKQQSAVSLRSGGVWEPAGPINIGGRISSIAVHPDLPERIFAGAASGGIFRTKNLGEDWVPVFDGSMSLSIGDMAIAPSDPNIIYVGTGEANGGGGSLTYDGVGVYKSINEGEDWQHLGLDSVGSIGKVIIHPVDPDIVFVAAMGDLFGNSNARGVYRTQDGGAHWEQVLFVSDSTGAIDIVIDPRTPEVLYAAMWERVRRPSYRSYGGPTSGIFKTTNGGDQWDKLESGLPGVNNGRIGLDIFPEDPDLVYAYITDDVGYLKGIYKTTNAGQNWGFAGISGFNNVSFMWWFGKVFAHPTDPNTVYGLGLDVHKSNSGGIVWLPIFNGVHVDQHDLFIHPSNPNYMVLGNDGGLYISWNGGSSWDHINNLPITQFYTCEVDFQRPERLYGGTQDNSTVRTQTGAADDWEVIHVGDGFTTLVDPVDTNYVYTESQYGNFVRSTNGGESFSQAMTGMSGQDRRNWNTPFVLDPHNPETLYYGAQKVYKTTNRAGMWTPISEDLSNGSGEGNLTYGTITSLAVSEIDPQVIYAGTDDGNVWNTLDGGENWQHLSDSLPNYWVTRVVIHPTEPTTAYAVFSGYRYGSNDGHIYRTTDHGLSWEDISGDLPDVPVNDLIIDIFTNNQLFLATDIGVFSSFDEGISWTLIDEGLPNVPVTDLSLHVPTRTLVAATYGRSLYKYEIPIPAAADTPATSSEVVIGPNPTNGPLELKLDLSQAEQLRISIYSIEGRLITTVYEGKLSAGAHRIPTYLTAPNGTYSCVIQAASWQKSVLLVKS